MQGISGEFPTTLKSSVGLNDTPKVPPVQLPSAPEIYMPEIFWHDRQAILAVDICQAEVLPFSCPLSTRFEDRLYKIATASVQHEIRLWNFRWEPLKVVEEVKKKSAKTNDLVLVPQTSASATSGGKIDCLEAVNSNKNFDEKQLAVDFLANLEGHSFTTNVVRFSPNGRFLASGDVSGGLFVWELVSPQDETAEQTEVVEKIETNDAVEISKPTEESQSSDIQIIEDHPASDENVNIASSGIECENYLSIEKNKDVSQNATVEIKEPEKKMELEVEKKSETILGDVDDDIMEIDPPQKQALKEPTLKENKTQQVGEKAVSSSLDEFPANREQWVRRCVIRHTQDVTAVCFSPDSDRIASVSSEDSLAVHRTSNGKKCWKVDHFRCFPNGVVWHPSGRYIVTMSTDRRMDVVDAQKGSRITCCHSVDFPDTIIESIGVDMRQKLYRVFHNDELYSFARMADFSLCGQILLAPAAHLEVGANNVYGTYAFVLSDLLDKHTQCRPRLLFPSLRATSYVRCSPVAYELENSSSTETIDGEKAKNNFLQIPYRLVFAVLCKDCVLLYNSQDASPFAYFDNLQLDSLTGIAWTPDGRVLVISSQEGYNTFIKLDQNLLGRICDPQPRWVDPLPQPPLQAVIDDPQQQQVNPALQGNQQQQTPAKSVMSATPSRLPPKLSGSGTGSSKRGRPRRIETERPE